MLRMKRIENKMSLFCLLGISYYDKFQHIIPTVIFDFSLVGIKIPRLEERKKTNQRANVMKIPMALFPFSLNGGFQSEEKLLARPYVLPLPLI